MKEKFSFREMLCYAFGDMGCNFIWTTVASFLMLYYTNSVGISAAATGTLMLITRLLDGVSDLVAGFAIDRTKTKWGKARPWILWTAPFMGIGLVLLFSVPETLPSGGKLVYAYITYILMAAVIYTACNLAYTTLLSLITPDPEIRSKISSIRFFFVVIAVLVISYATTPLVEKIGCSVWLSWFCFYFDLLFWNKGTYYRKPYGEQYLIRREGFGSRIFQNSIQKQVFYSCRLIICIDLCIRWRR